MVRHLLSMLDIKDEIDEILELAAKTKAEWKSGKRTDAFRDKSLAMIFEKPSTRTRVSFEVAMTQLGGHSLYLSPKDLQMGRGETIADTAKVLSRYVEGIMYRAFDHRMMAELAENATVPVINALDDIEHPCQILADLLTIKEHKGQLKGLKLAYVGDGNNVCNSLLLGCAAVGMHMTVGCPDGFKPDPGLTEKAREMAAANGCEIGIYHDAAEAVKDADIVYTDVWVSMGEEAEATEKERLFLPFQVNEALVEKAKPDCLVLHCLPAHRGYEITNEVVDGPHSVVFDEAENRLHAQKAVILTLMK